MSTHHLPAQPPQGGPVLGAQHVVAPGDAHRESEHRPDREKSQRRLSGGRAPPPGDQFHVGVGPVEVGRRPALG